jgi:Winged helix DNA-binding domain
VQAETLTLRAINRATLARQMLLAREAIAPVEAVERLCGLQAQEPRPPFVGLWSRLAGFERDDLRAALDARAIVRATLMRGTLHLVSARDLAAFRAPLQSVLDQAMRALRDRAEGLDIDALLPVARALLETEPRTFNELRSLLLAEFPDVNERALGFAVRMQLPLVMVPTDDRWGFRSVSDFTLAEPWIGKALSVARAPGPLVLRYLAAFGPATAADVQTWSGLQGIGETIGDLRPELRVFRDERGRELYDLPDAPRPGEAIEAPPRFLPEFDSLVLAHADRSRIVADAHRPSLVTKNLRVRATFLWDGFVQGTWTVVRKRKEAELVLAPFVALHRRVVRALSDEGESLLRFVEPDATTFAVRLS